MKKMILSLSVLALAGCGGGNSKSDPAPTAKPEAHLAGECPNFVPGVYREVNPTTREFGNIFITIKKDEATGKIQIKNGQDGEFFPVDGSVKALSKGGSAAGGCKAQAIRFNGASNKGVGSGTLSFNQAGEMLLNGSSGSETGSKTLVKISGVDEVVAGTCGGISGVFEVPASATGEVAKYKSFDVFMQGSGTELVITYQTGQSISLQVLTQLPEELPETSYAACNNNSDINVTETTGAGEDATVKILKLQKVPGNDNALSLIILDVDGETVSPAVTLTKK